MPLDTSSYLVSQGWSGKGTALRQGAIIRPLAIPQKRTLAGVGKDRDEAFPFWDHVFSAASKSIQIKVSDSDADEDEEDTTSPPQSLALTTTGILSNRRPAMGTPASSSTPSGTSTPNGGRDTPTTASLTPQLGLLTIAKRDAAKRGLYSRFFRGPILAPEPPMDDTSPCNTEPEHPVHPVEGPSVVKSDITKSTYNAQVTVLTVEDIVAAHLPQHKISQKRKKGDDVENEADKKKKRKEKVGDKTKEGRRKAKEARAADRQKSATTTP
ncbi:hypothetical protein BDN72DRAFT_955485 [Pluteus cervinus]|uniref:Uncharacterized protein n=1 Tax=Pluteus cervinus TaxID=181527 RepID=A0ACD3BAG8_9AGAR|nr:hypothetical protein BDN72DRAFT_955485 [Pluteus cervinus]